MMIQKRQSYQVVLFFLRIQWERQSREIETFTSHEGIARLVISQGVIRKDLDMSKQCAGLAEGKAWV